MRWIVAACAASLVTTGVASAQTGSTAARADETGYAEGFYQSALGNVTSQAFGAEAGINYGQRIRFFLELGEVGDTAPDSLGADAQIIASYLTQAQSGAVSYSVKQPMFFVGGGVRYVIPYSEEVEPYILGGFGFARVKRDVKYSIGGTEVTDSLANYGVVLGSDLSGTVTEPMLNLGGGVLWNFRPTVFLDAQYRFGRVFDEGQAFNVNRIGAGIGFRF